MLPWSAEFAGRLDERRITWRRRATLSSRSWGRSIAWR
jgi:hypothetical protein